MGLRFTVLASGSGGNATLVECDGFGLLIDAGLGPRQFAARLTAAGTSWASIHALLLTHTHTDHWNDSTLAHLLRRRVPVYCHPGHHRVLETWSHNFASLEAAQLVRDYEAQSDFILTPGLRCKALPVSHDSGVTFGFRLEALPDLFGHSCAVGYVADLGCWDGKLVEALVDVDLLALEFNHDVRMECASGRTAALIARVLGDQGHLSNDQAAALLREVLRRSRPGRLRHLVQLHLSRDCNDPSLAASAARAVLDAHACTGQVHTARQDKVCTTIDLGAPPRKPRAPRRTATRSRAAPEGPTQAWLPGFGDD
ncbi:MAG: MBL fold metallo-hydrolase [Planctomycetes bacterium]|nr:MBL fold metallo-hydrolase [Planctomycetota bacterium]